MVFPKPNNFLALLSELYFLAYMHVTKYLFDVSSW